MTVNNDQNLDQTTTTQIQEDSGTELESSLQEGSSSQQPLEYAEGQNKDLDTFVVDDNLKSQTEEKLVTDKINQVIERKRDMSLNKSGMLDAEKSLNQYRFIGK